MDENAPLPACISTELQRRAAIAIECFYHPAPGHHSVSHVRNDTYAIRKFVFMLRSLHYAVSMQLDRLLASLDYLLSEMQPAYKMHCSVRTITEQDMRKFVRMFHPCSDYQRNCAGDNGTWRDLPEIVSGIGKALVTLSIAVRRFDVSPDSASASALLGDMNDALAFVFCVAMGGQRRQIMQAMDRENLTVGMLLLRVSLFPCLTARRAEVVGHNRHNWRLMVRKFKSQASHRPWYISFRDVHEFFNHLLSFVAQQKLRCVFQFSVYRCFGCMLTGLCVQCGRVHAPLHRGVVHQPQERGAVQWATHQ